MATLMGCLAVGFGAFSAGLTIVYCVITGAPV